MVVNWLWLVWTVSWPYIGHGELANCPSDTFGIATVTITSAIAPKMGQVILLSFSLRGRKVNFISTRSEILHLNEWPKTGGRGFPLLIGT